LKVNQPEVVITQRELAEIAELDREAAWRAKKSLDMKSSVKAMLLSHIRVEPGRFGARLKTIPGRHVPWKTLVLERIPRPIIDAFQKLYPVSVRCEVVVTEYAAQPLWHGKDDQAIDLN
jgi:hypothetical protein